MEEEIRVAAFQWLRTISEKTGGIFRREDGPMLKHGFQELDGNVIHIPSQKKNYPDRERLDIRFTEFLSA